MGHAHGSWGNGKGGVVDAHHDAESGTDRTGLPTRGQLAVPDDVIRHVIDAGRRVPSTDASDRAARIDTSSYRTIARALVGESIPATQMARAVSVLLADGAGLQRFDSMSQAALASIDGNVSERVLEVHRAVLAACGEQRTHTEHMYEQVTTWLSRVTQTSSYDDVCVRAAETIHALSGFIGAAVYVPGAEHARFTLAAAAGASAVPGAEAPGELRIDRGLFADAMAGERPIFITGEAATPELPAAFSAIRTLLAIPLRDTLRRPAGLIVAWDTTPRAYESGMVDAVCRAGDVLSGVLVSTRVARMRDASVAVLPELAGVAHGAPADAADQLEDLCGIIVRATGSDAAIIRLRDPAGRFLETPAAATAAGTGVGDVIGSRSLVETAAVSELGGGSEHEFIGIDPDQPGNTLIGWSNEGLRMMALLQGRTVAAFPIASRYERPAVLYVIRSSSRPFDDTDRACMRIVTSHAQHVIDRHVSSLQVRRAIGAARNAIRLLGEALVAGVHTQRTSRFVPRLYAEMFGPTWCRTWQIGAGDGEHQAPRLVASVGSASHVSPNLVVTRAAERPLELHLNTEVRPHVAAVGMDEYGGSSLVVEFELPRDRSLGQEEQRLAVDVAVRISEALRSAGQAAAHERELERMQALQDISSEAHNELSEAHILTTIIDRMPAQYGADGAAVFVVEGGGRVRASSVRGIPDAVIDAVEASRSWVIDIARDEDSSDRMFAAERIVDDQRLAVFHDVAQSHGIGESGILIIPLTGREQTVGLVVLVFSNGLPDRIQVERGSLREFGRQVGSALVNAREFERERVARLRTQRMLEDERENTRQVRALHEVSRTFAASLSLDETMRAVVEAMAHRLDVDAVWIRTPNDRGDLLELRAFYASQPELSEALERMVGAPAQRTDTVMARVMQTRQPVLMHGDDPDPELADSEALGRLSAFLQHGSTIAVLPVAIPNEVLGTLTMLSIDPDHALTWDKVDIAAGVTGQAALALDNARLYQQQKNFAEVIQESLLPGRLPDIPGIELGVLYRSATSGGVEAPLIGGDFYDFLELEDGRLALAVGDVTGKGVGAAADTAMTKYIFRALAREHPSPSSFLRYANDVVCEEITPGKFVTLFYAVIDPKNGTILCGNAGHPEPKIIHADGDAIDGSVIESVGMEGLALGILPDQDYEERTYRFAAGATLVAYTDGVVEARREGRLYGQYRLERRLLEEAGASAPHVAFAVYQDCAAFADDGLGDDVAIVVAQRVSDQ